MQSENRGIPKYQESCLLKLYLCFIFNAWLIRAVFLVNPLARAWFGGGFFHYGVFIK